MPLSRASAVFLSLLATVVAIGAAQADAPKAVTVGSPIHISSLEPSQDGFVFQRMQVAETLVDVGADGRLGPGLAVTWSVEPDALTWRFRIRSGVRFHDGSPLSADVAAASLNRARTKPGPLRNAPISKVESAGDEVVVSLAQPFSPLPAVLANYGALILAPAAYDAAGAVVSFIGTGPFKVVEFAPPLSLRVRRFDDYWGAAPSIMEARYLSNHRPEARALMVESGDNQMAFTLDPAGFSRLSKLKGIKTHAVPIPRVIVVNLNLARPALADVEARRALSLAIDRKGIAKGILRFADVAATQLFPPLVRDWHDPQLPPLTRDIDAAKRLLAGLGWTAGADGVLTRDGQRFSLTLRTFPNRPELPLIAMALQDQWRSIGVELKVAVGGPSSVPEGHSNGSLDMGLFARNYSLTPDPLVSALEDFGAGGGGWGAMNWKAPDVAQALQTASVTLDPEARRRTISVVTHALQAEMPVLPIAWYNLTLAHTARLEGVIADPYERTFGLSTIRWVP